MEVSCQESSTKEGGRDEEKAEEDCTGQVRNEIVLKVVAEIENKARATGRCQGDCTRNSWALCQATLGTVLKSETKKRRKRKTGKRKTRWTCNGVRMRSWRRSWNEEGWKEALCRRKSHKRYQS